MYISFDLSGKSIRVLIVGRIEDDERIVYFLYPLVVSIGTLKSVEILFDDNETILLNYVVDTSLELNRPLSTYSIGDR